MANVTVKDKHWRSIVKATSWRITGTIDTMVIAYFVTHQLHIAFTIGSVELFTKMILQKLISMDMFSSTHQTLVRQAVIRVAISAHWEPLKLSMVCKIFLIQMWPNLNQQKLNLIRLVTIIL